MSHIFISYSRKDMSIARKIVQALAENNLDTWIDWEDIPKGEDWMEQIKNGIEQADAFLFLVSPDSIKSEVCNQEIDHAVQNGKRILPIVILDASPQNTHPEISKRNWIFCREGDDFEQAIGETHNTIHTDYEWLTFHTELQVKALKWQRSNHEKSLLLRGRELENAESMLGLKAGLEPQPVDLQREYILRSRQAVNRLRRQVTIGLGFGLIVMAILTVFAWGQRNSALDSEATAVAAEETAVAEGNARATALVNEEAARAAAEAEKKRAEEQAKISRAGELAAQAVAYREKDFPLSLLFGVQAYQTYNTVRTRDVLLENVQTNPQLDQYLLGHGGAVYSLAFSPDGKTFASGSWDGSIRLWDVEGRQPIGEPMREHKGWVTYVIFSPDGKLLASIGEDGIILWDLDTRQPIGESIPIKENADWVYSLAFSPDGEILASGNSDGSIDLWDLNNGITFKDSLKGHADGVISMAFTADGKRLASGSMDDTIKVWDMGTRSPVREPIRLIIESRESVVFSSDGKRFASVGDKGITIWNMDNGQPIGEPLRGNTDWVHKLAFSPDGEMLATGSVLDKKIILWDVESGQPLWEAESGLPSTELSQNLAHPGSIFGLAFSPDGKVLASGQYDGSIILWNVERTDTIGRPFQKNTASIMDFTQDGKWLASISENGSFVLWDVESGQKLTEIKDNMYCSGISSDGKRFSSVNLNGSINMWDVKSGQLIRQVQLENTGLVHCMRFSPDGKLFASINYDNSINLWDVENGVPVGQPLTGLTDNGYGVVLFSPDGKMLASGCRDGSIRLWDLKSRRPIGELLNSGKFVTSLAFSPDGKILTSGHYFGDIILWDIKNKVPIGQPLREHPYGVSFIAFSPDGKLFASSSERTNTLILWDVETRHPIGLPLTRRTDKVYGVVFSPDGNMLASIGEDGIIMFWEVNPISWIHIACQRAGRNFTHDEWAQYFPGEPYPTKLEEATCPQWPLEREPAPTSTP